MIKKIQNNYPHIEFIFDKDLELTIEGSFYRDNGHIEIYYNDNTDEEELLLTCAHEDRHLYQHLKRKNTRQHKGCYLSDPDEVDAYGTIDLVHTVQKHGWEEAFNQSPLKNYIQEFGLNSKITKNLIKKAFINNN